MLRVLAVDDEKPLLEELLYLLRSDPRVLSAEGASDATEALRRITRALESGPDGADVIDVVFLDIHMAGLTGLDIARLLAGFARPPLIVFVTAHEGFAVQAFDLKAVDYVLKPVRPERLAEAVRRACAQSGRSGEQPPAAGPGTVPAVPAARAPRAAAPEIPGSPVAAAAAGAASAGSAAARGADRAPEQIAVELGGVTRFVAIADIAYVEAQGDYARLHTDEGSHLVRIPLSTLEERWAARGFVRIHRRHLVALARIDELRLDAGTTTVRVGAAELQVSRRHTRELRDLLMRQAMG
ncbi:LytTR family DNA-binding domain-containing protein [Streptomyces sp. NBC_00347]|uniref:LytR/AlgR family response regulator transcription factor n=1 Tax=Streptomyces sp. NBC_00347 TaxID=2975721 RepID=UPI00225853BB|nr:LytTR family DNA-binding domain-containing protein [Streptomyces sp. NBC_00347]MCX5129104.1 LytTR family DNA-binding domain-containing protein [Streptomyces sp. NBC_00347]